MACSRGRRGNHVRPISFPPNIDPPEQSPNLEDPSQSSRPDQTLFQMFGDGVVLFGSKPVSLFWPWGWPGERGASHGVRNPVPVMNDM